MAPGKVRRALALDQVVPLKKLSCTVVGRFILPPHTLAPSVQVRMTSARGHDVLCPVPCGRALGVRFGGRSFSIVIEPVCSFSTRSSALSTSRTNDPMSYYSNSAFGDPKWAT